MTYLEEFLTQIHERNFHKFFTLWEEYCTSDSVDIKEFTQILKAIKDSSFTHLFGQFAETGLPLWETIEDEDDSYEILKHLIDLQTSNTPQLAELSINAIQKKYPNDPNMQDWFRLIGLRTKENFQCALSSYDLLHHMQKGNFAFHTKGWGTGEIMDVSSLRETVTLEFENVHGLKHITFVNAFKTLEPMKSEHFLARRFADADRLEAEAKADSLKVIKILLRDLGPKTAAEIKDELCVLVIPEEDWTKWWQSARSRIKKDTMIESPSALKNPFILRDSEVSHETRLLAAIKNATDPNKILLTSYSFVRDFPNVIRNTEVKETLQEKLSSLLELPLSPSQEIQILIFLDETFGYRVENKEPGDYIQKIDDPRAVIYEIDIIAFKKRVLKLVHRFREDWTEIFFDLLTQIDQNPLRDYIFDKLSKGNKDIELLEKLKEIQFHPDKYPEVLFWYFQKLLKAKQGEIPFAKKEGLCDFFESYLILMDKLDPQPEYRDLLKKMYNLLIAKRYEVVRKVIEGTDLAFIQEFLLLVAKCHIFTDHDKEIMRSLSQVVHPSLSPAKKKSFEEEVLWTTETSYDRILNRMKKISSVEMIENSKEVEAARELGDLRENAEYKYACEKRSRLQGELKRLSSEMSHARVITPQDVDVKEVGVGNVVNLHDSQGQKLQYTILGPWDADVDKGILSIQSRLAQAMAGHKTGDSFEFMDEKYTITDVKSFLDQ